MNRPALLLVLSMVFLEWLDFSLYLYLAKSVFSTEFFPLSTYSLTLTFALFAAAYLARPIGGWLFGREADLRGRRKPMVFSAALMGAATLGICLLPGYAQIGVAASWSLLVLRIIQGVALGGEINTSAMFLVEHHARNPLVAGSLVAASGALGMFMGGMLAAIIQYAALPWAWRIVFAGVGVLSLWVCRLRKQLSESPEFNHAQTISPNDLWRRHWRGMLNIAAIAAYVSVTVYLCNIFWLSFAIDNHLWSNVKCAWIASLAQCTSALLALPIAYFSKPERNKQLLSVSMVLIACTAPVLFYCTAHQLVAGVLISLAAYALTNGLICSALYYFLYQQLPPQYRCRGVSTIWALAATLGAICLPIAQQAVTMGDNYWVPALLVTAVALITLIIIKFNHAPRPVTVSTNETVAG